MMRGVKGRRVETDAGEGVVTWSKGEVILVKLDAGGERMFSIHDVMFL